MTVLPVVAKVLGSDYCKLWSGLVVNRPGSENQAWHTDGAPLFPDSGIDLNCHCLTVFIPLVDLDPSTGPTEFFPGSHRISQAGNYIQPISRPSACM